MKEDTKIYNDPISSDLLGALLSNNSHYIRDSRRSSNDSTRSTHARICLPMNMRIQLKNPQIPKEIEELLDHNLDWDFDIFSLEVLTDRK